MDNAWVDPTAHAFEFLRDGEVVDSILTWQQLDRRARAIGQQLIELGMPGKHALIMCRPGLAFVEAVYGCLYAGVVAVPAYPPRQNRHAERIELIARDAGVSVLLTTTDDLATHTGNLTDLTCVTLDEVLDERSDGWQAHHPHPGDLAILQYTSGSTGRPKGVMLTHENIVENCEHIQRAFSTRPSDRGLSWLPTYHDMGLVGHVLETVWGRQLSILMPPVSFLQSPARWLRAISKHRVTISGGPNFAYELCLRKISDESLEGIDLSHWDVAYNGSEVVRSTTLDRFCDRFSAYGFKRAAFYPCYGMAETTLIVSGGERDREPTVARLDRVGLAKGIAMDAGGPADAVELVGCGQTVIGDLLIVDPDTREPMADGEIGEIWLTGDSVAQGYFQGGAETSQTFQATLNGDRAGTRRFLRTGDLGFLRQGELFVTGRIKDVIISRGMNRYPQDIEQSIERMVPECIGQVAAFAIELDDKERLVVLAETEPLQAEQGREVVLAIRKAVANDHHVQVDGVALVRKATIPKTSSGKTQRFECRQAFEDNALDEHYRWTLWDEPSADDVKTAPAADVGL
ncbi:MAG: fatty acyl-AMP ligase, partial [Planctomycetota bacterium]